MSDIVERPQPLDNITRCTLKIKGQEKQLWIVKTKVWNLWGGDHFPFSTLTHVEKYTQTFTTWQISSLLKNKNTSVHIVVIILLIIIIIVIMFITITTARTIIPHVALLIFLSSFPVFLLLFHKSHPSFYLSVLVQKKFKRQTQVNRKVLEGEGGSFWRPLLASPSAEALPHQHHKFLFALVDLF